MFWTKKPSGSIPAKKAPRSRSKSAATSPAGGASKADAPVTSTPGVEERIRARAYQFFLERRGHCGSAEQDWLRAEAEVRDGRSHRNRILARP